MNKLGILYDTFQLTFLTGRYNKYSRELPQTPWLVEGERKMETSVQELICESLIGAVKADGTIVWFVKINTSKSYLI